MGGLLALVVVASTVKATGANFTGSAGSSEQVTTMTVTAPSGFGATRDPAVELSWTITAPRVTTTSIYRQITGGAWSRIAQVASPATSYTDRPGAGTFNYKVQSEYNNGSAHWTSPDSAVVNRQDTTFVFAGSTGFTATNCPFGSTGPSDMIEGYTPTGPESTFTGFGSSGTVYLCSDTFTAGQTMAAGTTTASLYYDNSSGAGCTVTATLTVNGTTTLGSGNVTANPSLTVLRTVSFATTSVTFAAGDRLVLKLFYNSAKACNSTTLHWDDPSTPSSVAVPAMP